MCEKDSQPVFVGQRQLGFVAVFGESLVFFHGTEFAGRSLDWGHLKIKVG